MSKFELPPIVLEKIRDSEYDSEVAMEEKGKKRDLFSDEVMEECPEHKSFLKLLVAEEVEMGKEDDAINDDGISDNEVDPDMKLFLDHLREDRKSYVFEMNGNRIKYEEEEEEEEQKQQQEEEEQLEDDDDDDDDDDEGKEKPVLGMKENCRVEFCDQMPRTPSQKSSGKGDFSPFLEGCNHVSDENDETYFVFLKHISLSGNTLVFKSDEGIVKYEKENEVSVETAVPLNVKEMESDEDDDGVSVQSLHGVDPLSEYEEDLRKAINVEFSMEELRDKYKQARDHKQMERQRELRGRFVSYPTEQSSSSYLDYYPELRHMIRQAMEKHYHVRALALLRCLFFYLKNLSHEGAFMPWRKPSALKMIRDLGKN